MRIQMKTQFQVAEEGNNNKKTANLRLYTLVPRCTMSTRIQPMPFIQHKTSVYCYFQ